MTLTDSPGPRLTDAVNYGLLIALLMRLKHVTAVSLAYRVGTTSVNIARWLDGATIRSDDHRSRLRTIARDELTFAQLRLCGVYPVLEDES